MQEICCFQVIEENRPEKKNWVVATINVLSLFLRQPMQEGVSFNNLGHLGTILVMRVYFPSRSTMKEKSNNTIAQIRLKLKILIETQRLPCNIIYRARVARGKSYVMK